jgi:hypothetical protein
MSKHSEYDVYDTNQNNKKILSAASPDTIRKYFDHRMLKPSSYANRQYKYKGRYIITRGEVEPVQPEELYQERAESISMPESWIEEWKSICKKIQEMHMGKI